MRLVLRKPSNSCGEAGVTVGPTPDGAAQAGIGVVPIGGAAWVGVVRAGGTGGDRQAVRRSRVGRDFNVRYPSLRRTDDVFAATANRLALSHLPAIDRVIRARSQASSSVAGERLGEGARDQARSRELSLVRMRCEKLLRNVK